MSAYKFEELKKHIGHNLECVKYGKGKSIENVAIECLDCNQVLTEYDKPDEKIHKKFYELCDESGFMDWIMNEFDGVSREATFEEIAEWAFGSIEECLEAWDNR